MAEQLLQDMCKSLKDLSADWSARNDALSRLQARLKDDHGLARAMLPCPSFRQFINVLNLQLAERRSTFLVNLCAAITLLAEQLKDDFEPYFDSLIANLFKLLIVTVKIIAISGGTCLSGCISHMHLGIGSLTQLVRDGIQNAHPLVRGRAAELVLQYLEQQQRSATPISDTAFLPLIEEAIKKSATDSDERARSAGRKMFVIYAAMYLPRAEALYAAADVVLHKKLAGIVKVEKKDATAPTTPAPPLPPSTPAPSTPRATPSTAHKATRHAPITPAAQPATPLVTATTTAKTPGSAKPTLQQAFLHSKLSRDKENVEQQPPSTPAAIIPPVVVAAPPPIVAAPPEPPKLVLPPADEHLMLKAQPSSPVPVAEHEPLPPSPEPTAIVEATPSEEPASTVPESAVTVEASDVQGLPIQEIITTTTTTETTPSLPIEVVPEAPVIAAPPVFSLDLSSSTCVCSPSAKPEIALSVLLENNLPLDVVPSSSSPPAPTNESIQPVAPEVPASPQQVITTPPAGEPSMVANTSEATVIVIEEATPPATAVIIPEQVEAPVPSSSSPSAAPASPAALPLEEPVEVVANISATPSKATRLSVAAPSSPPASRPPPSPIVEPAAAPVEPELPVSSSLDDLFPCTTSLPAPASAPATTITTTIVLPDEQPAQITQLSPLAEATFSAFAPPQLSHTVADQSASATVNVAQVYQASPAAASSTMDEMTVPRVLALSAVDATHLSPEQHTRASISFALSLSPIATATATAASAAPSDSSAPLLNEITSTVAATTATAAPLTDAPPEKPAVAKKTFAPSPNAASPSVAAPAGTPRGTPFNWTKKQQQQAPTPLPGMTPWRPPSTPALVKPVAPLVLAPTPAAVAATPVVALKKTAAKARSKAVAKQPARSKKPAVPKLSDSASTPAPPPTVPPTPVVVAETSRSRRGKPAAAVAPKKKAAARTATLPAATPLPEAPKLQEKAPESPQQEAKTKGKSKKKAAVKKDLKELFQEANPVVASPVAAVTAPVLPSSAPTPAPPRRKAAATKKTAAAAAVAVPTPRVALARISPVQPAATEEEPAAIKKKSSAKAKGKAKTAATEVVVVETKKPVAPVAAPEEVVVSSKSSAKSKAKSKAKAKAKAVAADDKENAPVPAAKVAPTPLVKRLRQRATSKP